MQHALFWRRDPSVQKRLDLIEAETQARITFVLVAGEYLEQAHEKDLSDATIRKKIWHIQTLAEELHHRPVKDVTSSEIESVFSPRLALTIETPTTQPRRPFRLTSRQSRLWVWMEYVLPYSSGILRRRAAKWRIVHKLDGERQTHATIFALNKGIKRSGKRPRSRSSKRLFAAWSVANTCVRVAFADRPSQGPGPHQGLRRPAWRPLVREQRPAWIAPSRPNA